MMSEGDRANFFIVGAPKSGTSALTYFLSGHPDVYMGRKPGAELAQKGGRYAEAAVPLMKELNYFGRDLERRFTPPNQEEYRSYFEGWVDESAVGDATVWYLFSGSAAREIRKYNPQARIVALLRDPVDLMFSQYGQMRYRGYEPLATFQEALEAEESRRRKGAPDLAPYAENYFYREIVRFGPQLQRYIDELGRERVHVILHRDLKQQPEEEFERLCAFLALRDSGFVPEFRTVNQRKEARSSFVQSFMTSPPGSLKQAVRTLLPTALRNRIRTTIQAWNLRTVERPRLDPELRRALVSELDGHIRETEEVLGLKLDHWRAC